MDNFLVIENLLVPHILVTERDFLVAYKPPRMHSVPLANSLDETMLEWCIRESQKIADLSGWKKGEGGLIHRLDYETHGLMLFARTLPGMKYFMEQQNKGMMQKEYSALTTRNNATLPGFPVIMPESKDLKGIIKSAFRPYGKGRKAVRPVIVSNVDEIKKGRNNKNLVLDKGNPYSTELLQLKSLNTPFNLYTLRIYRGFRHQIRCHLAWIGQPIINDELYGGLSYGHAGDFDNSRGFLGLRAHSLAFPDPCTGEELRFEIPQLDLNNNLPFEIIRTIF